MDLKKNILNGSTRLRDNEIRGGLLNVPERTFLNNVKKHVTCFLRFAYVIISQPQRLLRFFFTFSKNVSLGFNKILKNRYMRKVYNSV